MIKTARSIWLSMLLPVLLELCWLQTPVSCQELVQTTNDTKLSLNTEFFDKANVTSFKYRSYGEIVDLLLDLKAKYPGYVELFTAQDKYGIPLRDELQCTRHGASEPCRHYVLKITDKKSLPDPRRPQVFFSGALHGDERVGPQAVVELARFLLDHASRSDGNPWIQRLVKTRTIVIMPTTNAEGYNNNHRTEIEMDPNRDFNYGKASSCMETIVARAVNEVWRDHLFQLAITFHGGVQSISYEWGSTNHYQNERKSPDHVAQSYLSRIMSRYGAKFEDDGSYYPDGVMNDIVYAVDGGMEDWGYAASWENGVGSDKPIGVCNPKTYGGYSPDKSKYNDATNRAFNILIETSNAKEPDEEALGNSLSLSDQALASYLPESQRIGHVPRNLRIALLYIDLVQPYVSWTRNSTAANTMSARVGEQVSFNWEVAGSIKVDETKLRISSDADDQVIATTTSQSGVTRWYHADLQMDDAPSNVGNKGLFTEKYSFDRAGVYRVQAFATVDQNWKSQPSSFVPSGVSPQSHAVNARTNPNWKFANNGYEVQGQLEWSSPVITVRVQ